MAKQKHLTKAPIVEAIIDFRVKLPNTFQAEELSSLKKELPNYPKIEGRRRYKGIFKPRPEVTEDVFQGYFFKTEDEKNIAQFRIDGFTFNRLKPYTNWEDIFTEAKRLWSIYISKTSPDSITRLALRYINHINIPEPINNFSDYFEAPPNIPDRIPKSISSFLTKMVIHYPEQNIEVNFIQAFEKNIKNMDTIILDIDVYKQKEYSINDETIWSIFEKFHEIKNDIFFNNITEKTVRLFE